MSYQMYFILRMRMQQNYLKKKISYLLEYIGLNQNMTNILESIPKDKSFMQATSALTLVVIIMRIGLASFNNRV